MDQNLNPGPGQGQLPTASGPQATLVTMGETWAAGVDAISVSPRSRRLRWGIAAAVVLCVVVATAAGAFVLSGASGVKSLTATIAPKNSLAFLEVRTDLPGDQHANLADFMSHFPGFEDRAQFDNALDELLNQLTSAVSPDLTYSSAFKPWMEGEVSVAVTDLGTADTSTFRPPSAVAIFALQDRAAAESWVTSELARIDITAASQSYAGTTLYTTGSGTDAGAYAFTDQDLLLGTIDAVKAALDSKTNGSLADNANYQAAMNSLSGDSLARFYLDPRAVVGYELDSYNGIAQAILGAGASPLATLGVSPQEAPAWIAGSIRAESSDMVVDVVMPSTASTGIGNHTSALASALPASTVGVLEVHSIGKLVSDELSALRAKAPAGSATTIQSVQDALARFGGIDWLGDGVAVVTKDGSTYGGGLVAQAADASTASAKVALLTNLAALTGGSLNISSRRETYKGVDITLISIPGGTRGIPVTIAVAARGNLIVAGYTDAFVKAVIDTSTSTSLASQPDYSTVMAAAGLSNLASFYVDIPALEDAVGQAVFAASPSRWTLDYKPYFDHIGGVGYSVVDGNAVILRLVVTAK
ncbi:MAG TPA: DUF3352 domain-containing protein [Candidatus Limnocylindrales bacterium]|jgi:hypothetical protein